MSRIGKKIIPIPQGVKLSVQGRLCTVEGPKGKLNHSIPSGIQVQISDGKVTVRPDSPSKELAPLYGTTRAQLANMVTGVSQGFSRGLEISGVGFKAEVKEKELMLTLGFNHPVRIPIPEGIQVKVEKGNALTVSGANRHDVGQLASEIRHSRPADPYKEKGVKYAGEIIRRKVGKATVAKAA